jgi:hypothetical protein
VTFEGCQGLAQLFLAAESADGARSLVREQLAVFGEPGI